MRSLFKVTRVITLLSFLITMTFLQLQAQNTAPVPTTFEILSPSYGALPSLTNNDYTVNKAIFFGGDFSLQSNANTQGFLGFTNRASRNAAGTRIARGNPGLSRLTLGGTVQMDGDNYHMVVNLPGYHSANSFDTDDAGGGATQLDYRGSNGFIAINEEDSLVIRLTGYVDPNNTLKNGGVPGAIIQSNMYTFDIANPANDNTNGARFGVIPSTLPEGSYFSPAGIFSWVPNFIQGDGATDNKIRNGRYFIDANISGGTTANETAIDVSSNPATVGRGKGELKDSLYAVYFTATDDGIPPLTGVDSLFIMVNDSIANPPPIFTKRDVVNRNGQVVSYAKSSMGFSPDSVLRYSEGDSILLTFFATDQDSIRGGGANGKLTFSILKWNDFLHRVNSPIDSLALDTMSVVVGGDVVGFKVRLQVAFNVGDTSSTHADTVIVRVLDDAPIPNVVCDTMLFRIANVNRPPIWDADTSSKPADSAMVYAYDPAAVYPDSINAFIPLAVANARTDSLYLSQYTYDPDPLIGDLLGASLSFTASGLPSGATFINGLVILTLTSADTTSHAFTIKATDSDLLSPQSATKILTLRVAPQPDIAEIYPPYGYPGQNITIFGTGFGLFDNSSVTPSKVLFRARNSSGVRQNLHAVINSWGRDRINVTIPFDEPISVWDNTRNVWIPDTIEISSSVFATPTLYPYLITEFDTTTVTNMELVNLTSTAAVIKWKTAFTGIDSVIVATTDDSLDVTSGAFTPGSYPRFWIKNGTTISTTASTVQTFVGASASTDQIHYVNLQNLVPGNTYQFIIAMKDGLFFGETGHRVNGPYIPKKIDRQHAAPNTVNIGVGGFKIQTLPAQGSSGETFVVDGKAFTSNGAAINAVVTVKVIDHQNVADTSLGVVDVVKTDSSWSVNLGNAASDTFGVADRVFRHKQGDYLLITIQGSSDVGFKQFVATRGAATPQRINLTESGIMLAPSVAYDVRLKTGLNLIGIPVGLFSTEPQTAEDLLRRVVGGLPSITRFVSSTGTQETISKAISGGGRGYIGADDYSLALYQGYFVKSDQQEYVTLNGSVFGDTLPPVIFPSAALYWISRPAQQSDLFYAWSARTMLANIANTTEIFRYNRDLQRYESAVIDPQSGALVVDPENFHIDVSEGYILRVTAASQWDINTPSTVLLANASAKFDNVTGSTPSIVLNTSANTSVTPVSAALRNLRLSDVTSSAARVSWLTNGAGSAQVRYGKASEGLNMVAAFDAKLLDGGMRLVQLLNLQSETDYIYEIVANGITINNNGQPFTFKTAKVGIGIPYTMFSRLTDEKGQPLAKALVYLELKAGENVSAPLTAITDENGYWNMNLANLKAVQDGEVFGWNAGDEVRVTAVFNEASTTFRTLISGQSPQNVIKVSDLDGSASQNGKDAAKVALPKAFALAQNYPNPFNPSTTITFDVPDNRAEGVHVELTVYNIRGQVVRMLVNEVKRPGNYVIQWNGTTERGEVAGSGVYFYRIKAGDYVATRKMVLLK
jgi:flagellar hook assembly protein FlgD